MSKLNIKKYLKVSLVIAVVVLSSSAHALAADFETTSHSATVDVPEILTIIADTGAFSLTFSDWASGSESDQKTVVYTVVSNNMRQADAAPAINVNLDFLYDRIDFQAKAGVYTKVTGNTELVAASGAFQSIGTANVAVANKGNTTPATDGKLLNGSIPIIYKAVATDDLPSGPQNHLLFVTLTTV